jgi:hypothetical protein
MQALLIIARDLARDLTRTQRARAEERDDEP